MVAGLMVQTKQRAKSTKQQDYSGAKYDIIEAVFCYYKHLKVGVLRELGWTKLSKSLCILRCKVQASQLAYSLAIFSLQHAFRKSLKHCKLVCAMLTEQGQGKQVCSLPELGTRLGFPFT